MTTEVLTLETYSEADAADLLGVNKATLHWWLEGGVRRAKLYPPVIRPEPTGSRSLTWAEFVEAGLLRQYRRDLGVRLGELRVVIDKLRSQSGAQYPLARHDLWVGEGRHILHEIQREAKLDGQLWLVAPANNQLVLTDPAASFLKRVDWKGDVPVSWRPHSDEQSPVRCLPTRRFGRPSIGGISTEAIVEHLDAGESDAEVAVQFGLDLLDVRWASAFELSRRAPQAA